MHFFDFYANPLLGRGKIQEIWRSLPSQHPLFPIKRQLSMKLRGDLRSKFRQMAQLVSHICAGISEYTD